MGSENSHYFLKRIGQRRTESRVKKQGKTWVKNKNTDEICSIASVTAQTPSERKRFGRQIVSQYYLKQLQCSCLTQVYRGFWSRRLKDFQKSFKFQKWEESDAVQADREHWDGAENILSTGRSRNTHRPTEHPRNSTNCKNKPLTTKFKPGEFPSASFSGTDYCPSTLQAPIRLHTFTWRILNLKNWNPPRISIYCC